MASKAGVSFQTAGKVLNGKGSVSAQTRERILDAAKTLGYVPNALARSLVTRSTCTIGIVASDLSDAELARFVVGAEREARRQGHGVLIGSIDRGGTDAERYLNMLLERRVDGILTRPRRWSAMPGSGNCCAVRSRRSASIVFWEAGSRSSVPTTWRQPCSPPDIYSGWDIGASLRSWGHEAGRSLL